MDLDTIVRNLLLHLEHEHLNVDQIHIISILMKRQNVLGIYPTGFGQSDCYALFPCILDKVSKLFNKFILIIIFTNYAHH